MPGLNGLGHRSTALEQDALGHGAYAVLKKPVHPDVLVSVVKKAIVRAEMVK